MGEDRHRPVWPHRIWDFFQLLGVSHFNLSSDGLVLGCGERDEMAVGDSHFGDYGDLRLFNLRRLVGLPVSHGAFRNIKEERDRSV